MSDKRLLDLLDEVEEASSVGDSVTAIRALLRARDEVYDLINERDEAVNEQVAAHDHFVVICEDEGLPAKVYGPYGSWAEASDATLAATAEPVRCWGHHRVLPLGELV